MGKTGSWFSKVKKVLSIHPKEMAEQKPSKKMWIRKRKDSHLNPPAEEIATSVPSYQEHVEFSTAQNEQSKHAFSVSMAPAAQAAAGIVSITSVSHYVGKTKEEVAAIRIQTAFRGHMARRALRALKGLNRLKSLIHGKSVQRQATSTLHYMQTLAHVQSQIRVRRNRMSEENQALKRQLIQKHEKELERLRLVGGEDWNDSQQSKEKIEERLLSKQRATVRRERALAYAYSHQTLRNSLKADQFTFLDLSNPQWGWSWLERWMAARPWENHSISDTELQSNHGSLKNSSVRKLSIGDISKTYYTPSHSILDSNHRKADPLTAKHPTNRQTPPSILTKPAFSSAGRKIKSESFRRHNVAGSSMTDEESLASTPSVPSYMAPTESVKSRSKICLIESDKNGSARDISSSGSDRKHLSYTASPANARRHSGHALVRS